MSTTTVFVYTMNRAGEVGGWSQYLFPFNVDAFAQQGDKLYIRAGDDVLYLDDTTQQDYAGDGRAVNVDGTIQTPWLDFSIQNPLIGFGKAGGNRKLLGIDFVGTGTPNISIGYDESNPSAFTTPLTIPADTLPGKMIQYPVLAPSMSFLITFTGGQKWRFLALNAYMDDSRLTS